MPPPFGRRLRHLFLGHPVRLFFATVQGFAALHVFCSHGLSLAPGWGPSMLPTFHATREWFVTDKRYRRGRGVAVGDCVAFAIPDYEPGQQGVKRVLGMPGDYVLLNSPPNVETGGAAETTLMARRAGENMIQVPKGHCYLVGDNLPWSRDSREFGPLPLALIKGKVTAKASMDSGGWWPPSWFTRIESGLQKVQPDSR